MSEHSLYGVWVDCGGVSEMVHMFEVRLDALNYAATIAQEASKNTDDSALSPPQEDGVDAEEVTIPPFLVIQHEQDGVFFFKREMITGVRVVPDLGSSDDDDDDDDDDDIDTFVDDDPQPMSAADFDSSMNTN